MAVVKFVQEGNAVDYTPGADVAAGAVVVQNSLVGVAKQPIVANALGALAVSGVFDFPKATGEGTAIAAGKDVYWNATASEAQEDDETGTHKYLGKSIRAAGDDDETVRVRMHQ